MDSSPGQVLVVDDEPDIRESVAELLSLLGHRVWLATDGENAQQLLRQNNEVALIITDFRMPKLDGLELIHWCRREGSRVPIILISADRDPPRVNLSPCTEGVIFLPKPFCVDKLLRLVHEAMQQEDDQ